MNIDLYIFNLINGLGYKWYWLDFIAYFLVKYPEYILALVFLIILAVNFKKHWKMVFVSLGAAVISRFIIGSVIRFLWFRPRPFVIENVNLLIDYNAKEGSFPSGHALFYFALSTVIYLYNKKLGILFYIGSFLIILARVFVGIHWPSDILAGALIGIFVGWLTNKLFRKYTKTFK